MTEDYSKALSKEQRLNHSLVTDGCRRRQIISANRAAPAIIPMDLGSTDANIAISLGIPQLPPGAVLSSNQHQLEEKAHGHEYRPGDQAVDHVGSRADDALIQPNRTQSTASSA